MILAPESPFAGKARWRLGLPYLLSLSRLVCLLLFTLFLVLTFHSAEHAFEFCFVASSLAIVFVSALNYVCLHTFVQITVWGCFTLAYFRTLAFGWPSFCFITFSTLLVFCECMVYYFRLSGFVWVCVNFLESVWHTSHVFV